MTDMINCLEYDEISDTTRLICVPSKEIKLAIFNKVVLIERHKKGKKCFVGYIRGLNIKKGAIATTVAYNAHNILAIGDNDESIVCAIKDLVEQNGGYSVVYRDSVQCSLPLKIAGIMSLETSLKLKNEYEQLLGATRTIINSQTNFNPLDVISSLTNLTGSFYKLSTKGIIETKTNKIIWN